MGSVKYSKQGVGLPTALGIPAGCLGTYMIEFVNYLELNGYSKLLIL
jgi:hypothetical protein